LRRHWKVAVTVAVLAAVAPARSARAADMDPAPERLYLEPPGIPAGQSCQQIAQNPQQFLDNHPGLVPASFSCVPNHVAWANLMSELGFALAPSAFHPARTTGLGGFALSLEASFAHINADAVDGTTHTQYWHAGTQGPVDTGKNQFSVVNKSPDSILQIYTVKARKGLAYGFEITGALGYVANTSLWVGGADLHWAILEGYRTGVLGYLPDVAVGGGVRTLGGSPKFFLTTVGIDAQLSKPLTLADSAVLTPYIGAQRLIIFADSTVVDLTPNVDPLRQCGYLGSNVPGNPNAMAPYDGSPLCRNTLKTSTGNVIANSADFNNNVTFNRARVYRWRGIAGLTYRYEILYLAGQFAMDLEEPRAENANLGISGAKQWTVSFEVGVSF
jgi:hypothetical protein